MEIRVDSEVLRSLKGLAEESGLSLNQLMSGVARWASKLGKAGRPMPDGPFVVSIDDPGVVWFGFDGHEEDEEGRETGHSDVQLVIDYSESSAVRAGHPVYMGPQ